MFLAVAVLVLSFLLYNEHREHSTPYLKTMTILGNEVKILPNVYVYNVHIAKAKINKISGGCEFPYEFEVNDIFKKRYDETGYDGANYFVEGETYSYFYLNFEIYDDEKEEVTRTDAKYYFYIFYEQPLEIDEFCK